MKITKILPLNIKIGIYFFITNLILVLLLGGIFYFSSSHLLIQKDISKVTEAGEKSGNYIELYTNKLVAITEIMAQDESIHKYLKKKNREDEKRILQMINNIRSTDIYIKSVILIGKDGTVISNEKDIDMQVSNDMMKEDWYVQALKNHMPVLNPLRKQKFSKSDMNEWVLSVSKEIHDKNGGNLGVLLIDVKYQALREYLENLELGKDGDIIILDNKDRVVYYKNIPCLESKKYCLDRFRKLDEGYNYKTNTIMIKYPIKNTNWTLISISSLESIKNLKKHFFELIIISCLISLGITLIISTFILKRITKPIQKLENHMRDFSKNLSKIVLDGDVSTEIISLQNHFNEMLDKIKYLREYEINALHSQINPHFLYNTLDTIIWMAEFKDTDKVILITKSLANFFRISLSNGKEKIYLKDEIKHIQDYLYIQKQRYDDKLEYEININPELDNIEVPKIILQPIVENAIYHGIKNIDGIGKIKIYSQIYDNILELIVEDNGIGFKKNKKITLSKMGGIGIKNVNKRIQFYYGEKYGVIIDKNYTHGARVQIKLPLFL